MDDYSYKMKATTVVCAKKDGVLAIGGDGQVTLGNTVLKGTAKKIRRLYHNKILAGFAGSTSDALNLFEKFEEKLEKYGGNLSRAAVELSKDWRTDKVLKDLDALLAIMDHKSAYLLSGSGDVIEPDDQIIIGED